MEIYQGRSVNAQTVALNDAAWTTVGLPHTWNENDIYVNMAAGGPAPNMGGLSWYRKHFTLDQVIPTGRYSLSSRRAYRDAGLYQRQLDSRQQREKPQRNACGGIHARHRRPHPLCRFSAARTTFWRCGSETAGRFSPRRPFPRFPVRPGLLRLVSPRVDAHHRQAVRAAQRVLGAQQLGNLCAGGDRPPTPRQQCASMTNVRNDVRHRAECVRLPPRWWTPQTTWCSTLPRTQNHSGRQGVCVRPDRHSRQSARCGIPRTAPYGKPYLYKVYHIVKVGGATVDVFKSPLGIRVITWDSTIFPLSTATRITCGAALRGTIIPRWAPRRRGTAVARRETVRRLRRQPLAAGPRHGQRRI